MNLSDPLVDGRDTREQESKALEHARAYLAALAEHSPSAIIGLSLTGAIEFWNASAERILGFTAAEVVGTHSRLLSPADRSAEHAQQLATVTAGEIVRVETQVRHRDGNPLWVLATSGPVKAPGGAIIGVSMSLLDISASKATELQLRAAERRHSFIVRLGDFLRGATDATQVQTTVCAMLGQELRASGVYYSEYADDQDHLSIRHDYHDELPSVSGEWRLENYGHTVASAFRGGHTVVVNDSTTDAFIEDEARSAYAMHGICACVGVPLIRNGKLVMMMVAIQKEPHAWTSAEIALIEDTAERTWEALERGVAEERLRASEERLRQALLIETVGVVSVDPSGPILSANEAFLRQSGYTEQEVIAGALTWQRLTPPEFMTSSSNAMEELLARGHVTPYEKQYFRKDGTRWWGLSAATLLPDGIGVEFVIDVTQRRELEHSLREADRRKDEFLATLGHELRNPLAPIRHGLEIARVAAKRSPGLLGTINMMDRQLTHLVRLVDDLLDLGRISAGKIVLRKEAVDLNQLVFFSADAAHSTIDAHQHELNIDAADEDLLVHGDFDRLSQIVLNLLSNAAKYTPDGGRIRVRVRRDADTAVIEVNDTGIGIPQDELTRVFELFSQVRTHQCRAEGGLGIGLSLVKSLVAMHGGSVEACSAGLERGSTFIVRLPLSSGAEPIVSAPVVSTAQDSNAPRRIVVADDNRDAALALTALLELQGHDVSIAYDGTEAVELVRQLHPQVAILDLGMPNMSGLEAARAIRALPDGSHVKLVALTGWGQEGDRERTHAAGFDHHLVKPVAYATLVELLSTLDRVKPS